jgi:hypothetical protein
MCLQVGCSEDPEAHGFLGTKIEKLWHKLAEMMRSREHGRAKDDFPREENKRSLCCFIFCSCDLMQKKSLISSWFWRFQGRAGISSDWRDPKTVGPTMAEASAGAKDLIQEGSKELLTETPRGLCSAP